MQLVDQFLDRRNKTVRIKRIVTEFVGIVSGKHKLVVDHAVMNDILQGLLDAVRPRIGPAASGAGLVLRPVRKLTLRQASHAFGLVDLDLLALFRRHENHRGIRRPQPVGKPVGNPALGPLFIRRGNVDLPAARADPELLISLADRFLQERYLAAGTLGKFVEELVPDRR